MFPSETRSVFEQENENVLGKKRHKDHTRWPENYVILVTETIQTAWVSWPIMLKTQLNIMIKIYIENADMFLVGCTDYLSPLESPSYLQWRYSKYLDSSSVFNLVQSLLTRLHEISHLHPAPPWHHLYKEPVLDLSLKYITFSSDGTRLDLRVNLLP